MALATGQRARNVSWYRGDPAEARRWRVELLFAVRLHTLLI